MDNPTKAHDALLPREAPEQQIQLHRRVYRSMYAERSCRCTSHRYCVALEAREDEFVTTAVDPVFTLVREGCLPNRNFARAPERSRPHQEFLGSVIL
jgi:hypothetical protein